MPRSNKKNTICVCCGYKLTRPAKLCHHYKKTPTSGFSVRKKVPILGRDYITKEEAEKCVSPNARNPAEPAEDPETGPGPAATQAHRERLATIQQDKDVVPEGPVDIVFMEKY
ncbi:hypothetical protein RCL_jg10099.t1 [Rhizophagus clarus]|uniref:Uncharacterized protein n=1 Tax=Rhizophagus clarus TaxID=94130 RepID=A0A8H3KRG3_9GLOM|nr:hypothetical protein RCL_jg10099.t1 [Rhizophagus clarus]